MIPDLDLDHTRLASSVAPEPQPFAVYTSYDITHPPKHPGPGWTRFVCISDTHSHVFPVPPGDVLLHAGDLTHGGQLKRLEAVVEWLKGLPHPVKVVIAGNHDMCLDEDWKEGSVWAKKIGGGISVKDAAAAQMLMRSKAAQQAGIHYLQHESTAITLSNGRTWNFYGSPSAPRYSLGAFQYEREEGPAIYERIPAGTEILMTHTPAFNILDLTRKGISAGCKALAARMADGQLNRCRLHVFGHIHEAHGAMVLSDDESLIERRVHANAAMAYGGPAVIVDLLN